MDNKKPTVAITVGDPAGIGPEIIIKTLMNKQIYNICRPLVVGDSKILARSIKILNTNHNLKSIFDVEQAEFKWGIIDIIDLKSVDINTLEYGKGSATSGRIAFETIKKAIKLALDKKVDANINCPISKKYIDIAGFNFLGHTEVYAKFTNTKDYAMMLIKDNLRVAHVSTHVSLREACNAINKDRVLKVIELSNELCKKINIGIPKIGVAALNPHSGEGSLLGWEEEREIIPAIEEARTRNINVEGPIPADIIFAKAKTGFYDVVVAMFHDQGHIPLKLLGFEWDNMSKKFKSVSGVNITLGLPIIRASVDHGTAFDIAGRGIASEESLICAIEYGAKLAKSTSVGNKNG